MKEKHINKKDVHWQKITAYCAYQERCHKEVREKLYALGLYKNDVEQYISRLIEANYINEQRFAEQFTGGKFRSKQWGRQKIVYALRQKNISAYCIDKALQQIDDVAYLNTLQHLACKKWDSMPKNMPIHLRKQKVIPYLLQKGYENELIKKIIIDLADK